MGGKKCTFAHGEEDKEEQTWALGLKLCKTLIATGRCKNPNCRYAHSKEDIVAAKQLTVGLVDGQKPEGSIVAVPPTSGSDQHFVQHAQVTEQPVVQHAQLAHSNVRWFGFLYSMRWVCPTRASQRAVIAPPGVLEPPVASSSAVSHPMMQMTPSELPAAHQLEEKSLSVSPEPALQVVVKNTFIDIVETSPKSVHRSRSEPPRFMSREVEKRPRCQSAFQDAGVAFSEEEQSEADCLSEVTLAQATEMMEVSAIPSEECPTLPSLGFVPVEQPEPLQCIQESSTDGTNSVTAAKASTGEDRISLSSVALPVYEVRNTFIELCQSSPKTGTLRSVRSAEGRLDQLACEGEAIHQAELTTRTPPRRGVLSVGLHEIQIN